MKSIYNGNPYLRITVVLPQNGPKFSFKKTVFFVTSGWRILPNEVSKNRGGCRLYVGGNFLQFEVSAWTWWVKIVKETGDFGPKIEKFKIQIFYSAFRQMLITFWIGTSAHNTCLLYTSPSPRD